jgi:GT2 family glycosyltransferase
VGGFDVQLGAGAPLRASEDKDLCWRLLRAGWHGTYDPAPVVVHHQWRTSHDILRLEFAYGMGGGAFAEKVRRVQGSTQLLRQLLWRDGVRSGVTHLRHGQRHAAAACFLRSCGVAVGAVRARRLALDGGRFS